MSDSKQVSIESFPENFMNASNEPTFWEHMPLPFNLLFEDKIISYGEYLSLAKEGDSLMLEAYLGKEGYLLLGETKVRHVKLSKNSDHFYLEYLHGESDLSLEELKKLLFESSFWVSAVIAHLELSFEQVSKLGKGSVLYFDTDLNEGLDVYFADTGISLAKGEALLFGESKALRIYKILDIPCINKHEKITLHTTPSLEVNLVFARRKMSLTDIVGFGEGTIICFEESFETSAKLVFSNGLILNAEVMVVNDKFAARIVNDNRIELSATVNPVFITSEVQNIDLSETFESEIPFAFLEELESEYIASLLTNEVSQTIALVLSYLDSKKAAAVLQILSKDKQASIIECLSCMKKVSIKVIRLIENVLHKKIKEYRKNDFKTSGGLKSAIKLLNICDRSTEKNIIEALEEANPELAEEIKQNMFVFEDIVLLDDRAIQKLLREIESSVLALALCSTSEAVRVKFFNNMSKQAVLLLKETIDFCGPISLLEINKAQYTIVGNLRKLEAEGEIVIFHNQDELLV